MSRGPNRRRSKCLSGTAGVKPPHEWWMVPACSLFSTRNTPAGEKLPSPSQTGQKQPKSQRRATRGGASETVASPFQVARVGGEGGQGPSCAGPQEFGVRRLMTQHRCSRCSIVPCSAEPQTGTVFLTNSSPAPNAQPNPSPAPFVGTEHLSS